MNLVKCSNCRKILIAELFESHKCDMPLKGSVTIPVSSFYDCSTDEQAIVGIGLDGNRYWLVVKKREVIPLPDDFTQRDNPTGTTQNLEKNGIYIPFKFTSQEKGERKL